MKQSEGEGEEVEQKDEGDEDEEDGGGGGVPEGMVVGQRSVSPFQGFDSLCGLPRALPWAFS